MTTFCTGVHGGAADAEVGGCFDAEQRPGGVGWGGGVWRPRGSPGWWGRRANLANFRTLGLSWGDGGT